MTKAIRASRLAGAPSSSGLSAAVAAPETKSGDAKAAGSETAGDGGAPANLDTLIAFVKLTLKDKVKDVRVSKRLTESPVCLVADEGDLDMHLERILKQHRQIDSASRRILEINPGHELIHRLADRIAGDGGLNEGTRVDLEEAASLLLDQALIMEGESLPDPTAFARRLSRLVAQGLAAGGHPPASAAPASAAPGPEPDKASA